MPETFDSPIMQVRVANLDLRREAFRVYSVTMVLGSYVHLSGPLVPYRMVPPPMSKLQLKVAPTQGPSQDLIANN